MHYPQKDPVFIDEVLRCLTDLSKPKWFVEKQKYKMIHVWTHSEVKELWSLKFEGNMDKI